MVQPYELGLHLPVKLSNEVLSTTTEVWQMLEAAKSGDIARVKQMAKDCPALVYAQYNYTPPIHLAVREGHRELVQYLLSLGAHDPHYKTYPFQETLQVVAKDRGYLDIEAALNAYAGNAGLHKYQGDNGEILYDRSQQQSDFEKAVAANDLEKTEMFLQKEPTFALDQTYFWSEGILTFAAKENNRDMIDLLVSYGAKVPGILKWAQYYYLEHDEGAAYILEHGMSPNTMSWHHVTVLHDMAQKGNLGKAALLIAHGASLNVIDDEYQSTPLGLAAKWGHKPMVQYLLSCGADPITAGAAWATPMAWAMAKGYDEIAALLAIAINKKQDENYSS